MDVESQLKTLCARTVDVVSPAELREKLARSAQGGEPLRVKYGADPSAPDIHLGHVVGLRKLREFQDLGHIVVFIIGDFTGMIGDPTGRSETRKPLSRPEIEANAETYKQQVFKILDPSRTEVRYNSEWCSALRPGEFLKLCANVTVAQMLARDDFQKRHAQNRAISLVEFLYPVLQGYDSAVVKADVELGGTDQLFNLLVGRDMQKAAGMAPQVVMTLPLLEGLDGTRKMSKSLGNYVGVTEPPGDMFGKIMSISDDLMWKYYSLVLGLTGDDVAAMRKTVETGESHPRKLKDDLARRIVAYFHSEAEARRVSEEFAEVFSGHGLPADIPDAIVGPDKRKNGRLWIVSLLVQAGLARTNGEARRLVAQGAVQVDGEKICDPNAELTPAEGCVVKAGKRGFARIFSAPR